ncbi:putative uncharacterized protein [Waddlia chondrophila 2032/99]|uniref:Uncharacterized protein n=2 Tax=Waddlia chondrophila TaxID=71667 RepID=D6YU23_WADCW|nr:hypothetical protein [Waddlia chondrophila]ADI37634.1 hypothetical protein wcw_0259 [Waddlia chondrophila WSU 86-1044]CCB90619.1 putative uncharacterized protein [Waddlia chondrophila 2032/99]
MSSIRGFVQRLIGGYSSNDQKIQHPNKSKKAAPIGGEKNRQGISRKGGDANISR